MLRSVTLRGASKCLRNIFARRQGSSLHQLNSRHAYATLSHSTHEASLVAANLLFILPFQSELTASSSWLDVYQSGRSRDLVWMIGSVAVFGPTLVYLLSPWAPDQHTSSSHANAVPDHESRSFSSEDLRAAALNRPIMSDEDGKVAAGEGRPHGAGDIALRQMTTATEDSPQYQVTNREPQDFKATPEKMQEARAQAVSQSPGSANVLPSNISANARAKPESQKSNSN